MRELTESEARRLLAGIAARREDAIDAGDMDAVARLDAQSREIRAGLDELERPVHPVAEVLNGFAEWSHEHPMRALAIGAIALLIITSLASSGDADRPRYRSAGGSATPADPPPPARDPAMPTANQLRIAASLELESRAADPGAIDVRQCGTVGEPPETPPSASAPWRIRCQFSGANAFGGRVLQSALLDYQERGVARLVRIE